jgi:hypothetical protein
MLKANVRYWKLYFSLIVQTPVHKIVHEGIADLMPRFLKTQAHYFERKGVPDPLTETLFFGAVLDGIAFNYVMDPEHFPIDKIKQLIINKFSYNNQENYEN